MTNQLLIGIYRRTWLCLLITAFAYYLFIWLAHPAYTNWFTIKGVPYSDAARWYEMAKNIADAQPIVGGWSAQRPFYSFTIAAVYAWIGPSLWLPILFNVICASICVSLAFIIGERIFNTLTGWTAAFFFLLNPIVYDILFTITTEIYGVMLLMGGVLLLLIGLKEKHWKWWALAGFVFALSELTRPLAMGLMPAIFLVAVTMKGKWKHSLKLLTIFYAAFLMTVFPWMLRQKMVHNFWGVTDDTFESLYATSSPRFGSWDEWIKEEPANQGLMTTADNINYYKQAFFQNLKTQPNVYFNNVHTAFYDFLNLPLDSFFAKSRQIGIATAVMLLFLLILYFTSYTKIPASDGEFKNRIMRSLIGIGTISIVLVICFYLIYQRSLIALLMGIGIILVQSFRNEKKRLFILVFLFSGISLSLVAETNDYRFLTMVYWLHEMIYANFAAFCLIKLARYIQPDSKQLEELRQAYPTNERLIQGIFLITVFLAVSLVYIRVFPTKQVEHKYTSWYDNMNPQIGDILLWINEQDPELLHRIEVDSTLYQDKDIKMQDDSLAAGRLWFGIGNIGDKQYKIRKNEAVDHTARMFKARNYDHTIVLEDYFATVFDINDLSPWKNKVVLLVNRINIDTEYIQYEERKLNENVAIIPINDNFKPDFSHAYISSVPAHRAIIDSLSSISTSRSEDGLGKGNNNYNFFNVVIH